jgi:hypothetical protein
MHYAARRAVNFYSTGVVTHDCRIGSCGANLCFIFLLIFHHYSAEPQWLSILDKKIWAKFYLKIMDKVSDQNFLTNMDLLDFTEQKRRLINLNVILIEFDRKQPPKLTQKIYSELVYRLLL